MKFYCSRCDQKKEILYVRTNDEGKTLLLCPRCLAYLTSKEIYDAQPKPVKPVKPVVDSYTYNGNRMTSLRKVKRSNSTMYKLAYFIDNKKVGFQLFKDYRTMRRHKSRFLKKGEIYKGIPSVAAQMKKSGKASKNKVDYIWDYNKKKYKQIFLQFSLENDKELIEDLMTAQSKAELVRTWYKAYCDSLKKDD